MNLRCDSCGANLRVPPQVLESGKSSAKCPRCKNQIAINPAEAQSPAYDAPLTIRVVCGSCGAKLKAPAQKAGSSSRCPRCKETIEISEAGETASPTAEQDQLPMAARGTIETHHDESGATTRRMDSRTLGMLGMTTAGPSGEVNLDDLVRKNPPHPVDALPEETGVEQGSGDIATALMNPPVEDLKKAAESIRAGSAQIPSEKSAGTEPTAEKVASPAPPVTPAMKPRTVRARQPAKAAPSPSGRDYPVFRGFLAGGLSGAFLGAAWMALSMTPVWSMMENYAAPLPLAAESFGLSDTVFRLVLLAVVGSLIGFVAGAIGASASGNALSALRCGLIGALAGAALGMSGGMDPSTGFRIWPVAHWIKDLLLVGLLTPALNKFIPGR